MAIHVNIGEAKTRLSELIAATERGEEVVIARAGRPVVRLSAVEPPPSKEEISARRRAFFGSLKGQISDDIDWSEPTFTDEELDSFERPF
jgi:prevent-host-death family protein